MLVYCDANVLLDFILPGRGDNIRPLDEIAFYFFSRGWNCAFNLVVSDWAITEAKKYCKIEDIDKLIDIFKEKSKFTYATHTDKDVAEAKRISADWQDALHALIAIKYNCDVLVTTNVKHFAAFFSKIDISHPGRI